MFPVPCARLRRAATMALVAVSLLMPLTARAQESGTLTATIYRGNCFDYDDQTALPLADLVRPGGVRVLGLPAFGESVVDRPLQTLRDEPHALVVERKSSPGFVVACGEIRGTETPDGSLAIGLREQNASFFAGIAVLQPAADATAVRAYVGSGLGRGTTGVTGDPELPIDDSVLVTVRDGGIVADQTEFTVGSRVEFIVTNDGSRSHEVMLERRGGNEEPLEENGEQAETEDLAPGEGAVFVFTFTEPGSYQLADHIGDNELVLRIEVS